MMCSDPSVIASCPTAEFAMTFSSSVVKTFPVGLFGVLMRRAWLLNAVSSSAGSNVQSARGRTNRGTTRDDASARFRKRLEDDHFVAGIDTASAWTTSPGRAAADRHLRLVHLQAVRFRNRARWPAWFGSHVMGAVDIFWMAAQPRLSALGGWRNPKSDS